MPIERRRPDATPPERDAANPIVLENRKPGNPSSEWDIAGGGDPNIEGFATDISVGRGETVGFKIRTDSTDYRIDIYRLGYYAGLGARKVFTLRRRAERPQDQPEPLADPETGLVDAGNWAVSAAWTVPEAAVSGVYIAKLVRQDGIAGQSHIPFVVRDDGGTSDILFQTSDTTWQAYNAWGGACLYGRPESGFRAAERAHKVSYNRPFDTRSRPREYGAITFLFDGEYPMIRWLEANGYDVAYWSGVDTDRRGSEIRRHKVFCSVGHDEYWSGGQRAHVEAARDAGVHLAFFSGNEIFWKISWEAGIAGSAATHRTMVCRKETYGDAKTPPGAEWTGTWRDPRGAAGGAFRPENALTGTLFTVNAYRTDAITVPHEAGRLRFWRHTDIARLAPGQAARLPENVLGFEWDEDIDNGCRPAGLIHLSSTTVRLDSECHLQDHGVTFGAGTATHSLVLYRAPSGALVFGAGTPRWTYGLDAAHDGPATPTDLRMQQATLNLFADMGVQPRTRAPGLAAAAASSDALPPTAVVTTPADTVKIRRKVVIRGTAADAGGVVAAVEVSVDGGRTWHMASGQESWSFTWIPPAPGSYAVLVRAVDDSLNLGEATAGPIFIAVAPPLTRARVVAADALRGVAQASVAALRSGRRFRQRLRLRQRLRGAAFRVRRGARRLRDAVGRTAARRALP